MASIAELLKQAREKREMAATLRRLSRGLSYNDDHARVVQQIAEVEAEARELERQCAESSTLTGRAAPPVQQEQVQQQQQHDAGPPQEPKSKS